MFSPGDHYPELSAIQYLTTVFVQLLTVNGMRLTEAFLNLSWKEVEVYIWASRGSLLVKIAENIINYSKKDLI